MFVCLWVGAGPPVLDGASSNNKSEGGPLWTGQGEVRQGRGEGLR